MSSATNTINVPFSVPFVHQVRFTTDVFGPDQDILADSLQSSDQKRARVQFWVDSNVMESDPELRRKINHFCDTHSSRIARAGSIQIAPGGEEVKNDIHLLERMLKVFNAAQLDRRCYVAVIGGGAVLDAVGFATAIAHRGLRLVRLPTTTLGQADSGLGVKNGVNLFFKKNWLGTFAVPWAVINDTALLETLTQRDFIAGFSEAVKVALLKDVALFDTLCENAGGVALRNPALTGSVIRRSAELHLDHITRGGDPFEMREARPLDFGHWSAHKLEAMSDFELRHGEAVAIGVAIDCVYSALKFGFNLADANRVLECLCRMGFVLNNTALHDADVLLDGLEEFRQHLGGQLTLTMLEAIGQPFDIHEVDSKLMHKAIQYVLEFKTATTI